MCSIDGAERPDVYSECVRRARVPHTCAECSRTINQGETYSRAFGVYDRMVYTYKTCAHCRIGQEWLLKNCNGFMHFGLAEEMQEHADTYPDQRFGFIRIKSGMMRKWQRFDGAGLMRLPPLPAAIGEYA